MNTSSIITHRMFVAALSQTEPGAGKAAPSARPPDSIAAPAPRPRAASARQLRAESARRVLSAAMTDGLEAMQA